MREEMFAELRRVSETSLQMQQDLFRNIGRQLSVSPSAASMSTEWARNLKNTWLGFVLDFLNEQRASLDSTYRSAIQIVDEAIRATQATSAEDYRHAVEEVSKKLFETFKGSSETQFKEFQKWTEKSFEIAQKAQA